MIEVMRVCDSPGTDDGTRFLVECLWPRGRRKESLHMEGWLKDVAPGDALRRCFGHDPAKWIEFQNRYFAELDGEPEAIQPLVEAASRGQVTLLYSAHDTNTTMRWH
jgi:uncharacterized protein YeaO (DUF488 family)